MLILLSLGLVFMVAESSDKFFTVGPGPYQSEIKINGSRFIGHIFHVVSQENALEKYQEIQKQYHDATHNCYAYRIDDNQFRYSDDGEPSGTAGRPMYQIIEGQQLFQVLAVVTRYFGGTKLGTGGLIRAYSDTVRNCLELSHIKEKIRCREVEIITRYDLLRNVREIITRHHGNIVSSDYSEKVVLICQIPLGRLKSFQEEMIYNVEISEL